jgi:hypothetical protein
VGCVGGEIDEGGDLERVHVVLHCV